MTWWHRFPWADRRERKIPVEKERRNRSSQEQQVDETVRRLRAVARDFEAIAKDGKQ